MEKTSNPQVFKKPATLQKISPNSRETRKVHNTGLGLEGLWSRLGLGHEGFRSRALSLETVHRLFFIKFCKKEFLKKRFN